MALESNIYALWASKQTAKGTPNATGTKRLVQVAGDFTVNRSDGAENYSDLDRFGSMTDYVDSITGEGNPGIEAQPDGTAYVAWLFHGQETVTGAADPYTHAFSPGTNGGFWSTWTKRVGQNVIQRQQFNDCRIGTLTIEGSTGARVVRVTPTILSLDPGQVYTTDPVAALSTELPFLYQEGQGTFTLNSVVLAGQSQFTATWDEGLGPYYGDDVVPVDLVPGNASVSIAVTILVDTAGFARYNERIYGTASPTAGTKPIKALDTLGSYAMTLTKKNNAGAITPARDLVLSIPTVKWAPDVAIPPNPDGGAIEISLAGTARKTGPATPVSTLTIRNGVPAYTT